MTNQQDDGKCIASKIQRVQEFCLYPNLAESATTLIHARLISLQHVLGSITEPVRDGSRLQALWDALNSLQTILVSVLSMNRIVYMVHAQRVQDQLETSLEQLQVSLESLLDTLSPAAQHNLNQPHKDYYALCDIQTLPLSAIKVTAQREQARFAGASSAEEFEALLKELIGAISADEITQAVTVLEKDGDQITRLLQQQTSDPISRSKAIQLQGFMGLVMERLKGHSKYSDIPVLVPIADKAEPTETSKEPTETMTEVEEQEETKVELPQWALDPITQQPMQNPVTLRAPCEHNMDKSTFLSHMVEQGNTCCPVCQTKLKSMSAKPNKELTQKIRELLPSKEELTVVNPHQSTTKAFTVAPYLKDMEASFHSVMSHLKLRDESDLRGSQRTASTHASSTPGSPAGQPPIRRRVHSADSPKKEQPNRTSRHARIAGISKSDHGPALQTVKTVSPITRRGRRRILRSRTPDPAPSIRRVKTDSPGLRRMITDSPASVHSHRTRQRRTSISQVSFGSLSPPTTPTSKKLNPRRRPSITASLPISVNKLFHAKVRRTSVAGVPILTTK